MFSAALATSGSVTLFHAPGHTAEADTVEQAFAGAKPKETHEVTRKDLDAVYDVRVTGNRISGDGSRFAFT